MVKPPYDDNTTTTATLSPTTTVKFLCSYGGKILPRYPDGILRYFGGHTRVVAVNRSISFPKLLSKLEDLCGTPVSLRCQLPTEDLDALISVKSDEDLANLIEEYDRAASSSLKIKAFLSTPSRSNSQKPQRTSPLSSDASSPTSSTSSSSISSPSAAVASTLPSRFPAPVSNRCFHQAPAPIMAFPFTSAGKVAKYAYRVHHGKSNPIYFVHNGNSVSLAISQGEDEYLKNKPHNFKKRYEKNGIFARSCDKLASNDEADIKLWMRWMSFGYPPLPLNEFLLKT